MLAALIVSEKKAVNLPGKYPLAMADLEIKKSTGLSANSEFNTPT
jgi:hypothetical protein